MTRRNLAPLVLAALLALLFAAPGAYAARVESVTLLGPVDGQQSEWVEWVCVQDGALYLRGSALYRWEPGMEAPEMIFSQESLPEDSGRNWYQLRGLFAVDGQIAALDCATGALVAITADGLSETGHKVDLLSLPGTGGDIWEDANLFEYLFVQDGKLFALTRPDPNNWDKNQLFAAELGTGTFKPASEALPRVNGVVPYKDGKLLLLLDQMGFGTIEQDQAYCVIRVLDPKTGAFEGEPYAPFLGYNGARAIAYDPEADLLYIAKNNGLYRAALGGEPEQVNYLPNNYFGNGNGTTLLDGRIVLPNSEGTMICSTDPANMPARVLRVEEDWGVSSLLPLFSKAYPDVAIEQVESGSWDEGRQAKIMAGELDVLSCSGLGDLPQKGFALDLSGDAALTALAEGLYPQFKDAVMWDGKLYAAPISLSASIWAYDQAAFEELGLPRPDTLGDFMDLLVLWDDISDDHPDYQLMDSWQMTDLKGMVFWEILGQYIRGYEAPDAPLSFNHPAFLEPMRKLETLPFKFMTEEEAEAARMSMDPMYREPLLEMYYYLGGYRERPKTMIPPPRLIEDAPQFIDANVSMLVINPNSPNLDAAQDYVRFIAQNLPPRERIPLTPEGNEPVENEWYTSQRESIEQTLKEMIEAEVEPQNQREHDAQIEEQRRYLEQFENERWRISPREIEQYQALAPLMRVDDSTSNIYGQGWDEFRKIMTRYQQGQLSLEQMVLELDRKAEMIYKEAQ